MVTQTLDENYTITDVKEYIELISSIISDVVTEKYQAKYGLVCASRIFKNFSHEVSNMVFDLDDKENIADIIEVFYSVDYLYKEYIKAGKIDNVFLRELNFPFIPDGCKIVSLIYIKDTKTWGCTNRFGKTVKLRVTFGNDILSLFKKVVIK